MYTKVPTNFRNWMRTGTPKLTKNALGCDDKPKLKEQPEQDHSNDLYDVPNSFFFLTKKNKEK